MRDAPAHDTLDGRNPTPLTTFNVPAVVSIRVMRLAGSRSVTNREVSAGSAQVRSNGEVSPATTVWRDPSLSRKRLIRPPSAPVVCSLIYAKAKSALRTTPTAKLRFDNIAVFAPVIKLMRQSCPVSAYSTTYAELCASSSAICCGAFIPDAMRVALPRFAALSETFTKSPERSVT